MPFDVNSLENHWMPFSGNRDFQGQSKIGGEIRRHLLLGPQGRAADRWLLWPILQPGRPWAARNR